MEKMWFRQAIVIKSSGVYILVDLVSLFGRIKLKTKLSTS